MIDLESLYQNIQTVKHEYINFQGSKTVENHKNEYKKAIVTIISEIKSYKPRIQQLILQTLQASKENGVDENIKEIAINSPNKTVSIPLHLNKMFRAGYSTNVDFEIQKDIEDMQGSEVFDIQQKDKKPLFTGMKNEKGDLTINDPLGELILKTKDGFTMYTITKKPIFSERITLTPFNTMALGEMQDLKMYKESDRLPDQLAYYFYKQIDNSADNFYWLGDHIRYSGINGLSIALSNLLQNYIYEGQDIYKQHIKSRIVFDVTKSPIIQEFNKIFDGYISLDIKSEPGCIIYQLGSKFKQPQGVA